MHNIYNYHFKIYLCATVLATLFMACNKDSDLMTTETPAESACFGYVSSTIMEENGLCEEPDC